MENEIKKLKAEIRKLEDDLKKQEEEHNLLKLSMPEEKEIAPRADQSVQTTPVRIVYPYDSADAATQTDAPPAPVI